MTQASDTSLRQNRIPIMMSDEELRDVDDYRFLHRMGSRAAAMRDLIDQALCRRVFVHKDIPAIDSNAFEVCLSEFQKRTGGFGDEDDRIEITNIIRSYLYAALRRNP